MTTRGSCQPPRHRRSGSTVRLAARRFGWSATISPTASRRRVPRKLAWAAVLVLAGLLFRKVIAWAAGRALRGAAPVRVRRPLAAYQVGLAMADGERGHDHGYRHRTLGAAEDRGHLQAGPGHRELQLHVHSQGLEEHRHLAVLVLEHLRHRRPRLGHRGPQPGARLVDTRIRALPAAGPRPARDGHPRPGERRPSSAAAPATAVRSRRHRRQHNVPSDRRAAQLDLSRARLRRADTAAVLSVGAL